MFNLLNKKINVQESTMFLALPTFDPCNVFSLQTSRRWMTRWDLETTLMDN
jgi:hypothetical protein